MLFFSTDPAGVGALAATDGACARGRRLRVCRRSGVRVAFCCFSVSVFLPAECRVKYVSSYALSTILACLILFSRFVISYEGDDLMASLGRWAKER